MNENTIITGDGGPYGVTDNTAPFIPLLITAEGGKELIRIGADGSVRWNGREIESDAEFRAAMLDLVKLLVQNMRPAL